MWESSACGPFVSQVAHRLLKSHDQLGISTTSLPAPSEWDDAEGERLVAYTVKSITAPDILPEDGLKLVRVTSAQMYEPYLPFSECKSEKRSHSQLRVRTQPPSSNH